MIYEIVDERSLGDLILEAPNAVCDYFPSEISELGSRFGFVIEIKTCGGGGDSYACVRTSDMRFTHFLYLRNSSAEFHIDESFLATGNTKTDKDRFSRIMDFAKAISRLLELNWKFFTYDNGEETLREEISSQFENEKIFSRYLQTIPARTSE
ncbi:MAG: hypothetical protein AAFN77_24495 [Planctomycetota bacterium]